MVWQIGNLTFLNPWALAALIALPILWFLLRFTPPKPELITFPPIRFLLELVSREETPHRTPWWLILLRLSAVTFIILAIAEPVLNQPKPGGGKTGPLLLIVDDSWAAAKNWQRTLGAADQVLDRAARQSRPVITAFSVPRLTPQSVSPQRADVARDTVSAAQPQPLRPNRMALAKDLSTRLGETGNLEIVWLSDGVDYGEAVEFTKTLSTLAGATSDVSVFVPDSNVLPNVINKVTLDEGKLNVSLQRAGTGQSLGEIQALALNSRNLGTAKFNFPTGASETSAQFDLPIALRNEISRIEIAGERSAGATYLIDDTWRRKTVGLVSGAGKALDQPLLSPLYYVSRALEPFAEVYIAPADDANSGIQELIDAGLSVLVLADIGQLQKVDLDAVKNWLNKGGTLVRFAGPRMAARHDDLVPVPLRRGGRALGGALSWTSPQKLSPFEETSPFFGLNLTGEVTVNRQVLAEPVMDLGERSWARLEDGTPLVTAAKNGAGTVILFHVTAEPSWSNLPLSGLFVEMLRRVVSRAQGVAGTGEEALAATSTRLSGAFAPVRTLNGYGEITTPPADAAPISANEIAKARPSPDHPPGLYRRGGQTRAINIADDDIALAALPRLPSGMKLATYSPLPVIPLKAAFLVTAFLLLLVDALASLWLAGRLTRANTKVTAACLAAFSVSIMFTFAPGISHAQNNNASLSKQDGFAMQAALDTRIGFVLTGDARIDKITAAGLEGLTDVLFRRTSLEPEKPMAIDIEKDDIVFFPLIYWPVDQNAQRPSEKALAKISTFMKNGGTIFFDTRDHQTAVPGLSDGSSAGSDALRRIIGGLDIPPLETVPAGHVITKAFYLLQHFPGRWLGGGLWVEARDGTGASNISSTDGVSSVIIGSNDYAAAWAVDGSGRPMFATVPGTNRQREFAMRTGVNIVMYALTGNYKADQVHVPSILERLGQ
jgi:hypothetical protein